MRGSHTRDVALALLQCVQAAVRQEVLVCVQVVRRLYASGGWGAFYKGLLPEYLKVIPSVSIAFCFYEMLKTLLDI